MVNAFHLASAPGASAVKSLGGIHAFTGFHGTIASDSGGYQIYSMVSRSKSRGRVTEKGLVYRSGSRRYELTPSKAIQRQWRIGADILFCLDHCTHPSEDADSQRASVENTIRWAAECKQEFDRLRDTGEVDSGRALYAVVQGGRDTELRRRCAGELRSLGFDGYGYGGWPVDAAGELEASVYEVPQLIGPGFPLHALGIGSPRNVVAAAGGGYTSFDCVMPTRDARHGRLFVSGPSMQEGRSINIKDERFVRMQAPVDDKCDCECCSRHTAGFLNHLFVIGDPAGARLATIHNLRYYVRLMKWIRETAGG
jgi:queuine tRNA-ribosyltransferase